MENDQRSATGSRAILDLLTRVHSAGQPDENLDAVIPADLWRELTDLHAAMLYESARPSETRQIGFNEFLGRVQGRLLEEGYKPPIWPDTIRDQGDLDSALDSCVKWCKARLDEARPSARAASEWVSVDKKLPPLQQIVLVLANGVIALDYLVCDPNPQHSHWAAHQAHEIHHWHEIPSAPSHLPRTTVAL